MDFILLTLFLITFFRQRRGLLQLQQNQKVSPKTRKGSIKSTKIKIRRRIRSIRSTNTVIKIKIEVKIKTRRRRIEVDIMIPVVITLRNTMKRLEVIAFL